MTEYMIVGESTATAAFAVIIIVWEKKRIIGYLIIVHGKKCSMFHLNTAVREKHALYILLDFQYGNNNYRQYHLHHHHHR